MNKLSPIMQQMAHELKLNAEEALKQLAFPQAALEYAFKKAKGAATRYKGNLFIKEATTYCETVLKQKPQWREYYDAKKELETQQPDDFQSFESAPNTVSELKPIVPQKAISIVTTQEDLDYLKGKIQAFFDYVVASQQTAHRDPSDLNKRLFECTYREYEHLKEKYKQSLEAGKLRGAFADISLDWIMVLEGIGGKLKQPENLYSDDYDRWLMQEASYVHSNQDRCKKCTSKEFSCVVNTENPFKDCLMDRQRARHANPINPTFKPISFYLLDALARINYHAKKM